MDWFSWLSRTNLEPSLIYDYGITFARNELQLEDSSYFDHEFLQSMGISIAKHRLEILKLAKKENNGVSPKRLSGVIKRCLRKCASKLGFREGAVVVKNVPDPNWYQEKWRGALVRKQGSDDLKEEKPIHRARSIALSGPLDGRMHERVVPNKVLKLSGPIDGRMQEKLMYANRSPLISRPLDGRMVVAPRSPKLSGPLGGRSPRPARPSDVRPESPRAYCQYNKEKDDFDCDDDHALWPTLFQDLKPT